MPRHAFFSQTKFVIFLFRFRLAQELGWRNCTRGCLGTHILLPCVRDGVSPLNHSCTPVFALPFTGCYWYSNGAVYEGEYRNGRVHGKGRATFPSGDSYAGEWREGAMSGTGVYEFKVEGAR